MVNTYTENIFERIKMHGWKYRVRGFPIIGVLIHATRSGQPFTTEREYQATKNWALSPDNKTTDSQGRTSAAMFHCVIGGGGKLCIVLPDDVYPTWSAGHLDTGGYYSIELAQPTNGTPYDPLDLERCEHHVAAKCRQYGIPPVAVVYISGDNHEGPGIVFHDGSRNGELLGKSDPGTQPPFNNRTAWVKNRIAPLVFGAVPPQEDDMKAHLAWDIGRERMYFVGPAGARWVTNAATVKELERQYGPLETKALSTEAIIALGG